jgi:hypothetical protein
VDISDKSVAAMKCPTSNNVIDLGTYYCGTHEAALYEYCSSVINHVCGDFLQQPLPTPSPTQTSRQPCLMYSIGIGGAFDLEDFTSDTMGYDVYAFDPANQPYRTQHIQHQQQNAKFHFSPIGLAATNGSNVGTGTAVYGEEDVAMEQSNVYKTLAEMWLLAGHATEGVMSISSK